jgi:hypothetical protein
MQIEQAYYRRYREALQDINQLNEPLIKKLVEIELLATTSYALQLDPNGKVIDSTSLKTYPPHIEGFIMQLNELIEYNKTVMLARYGFSTEEKENG